MGHNRKRVDPADVLKDRPWIGKGRSEQGLLKR
jgi:hypothetical protein